MPLHLLASSLIWLLHSLSAASADCIADMKQPQLPADPALCRSLDETIRKPSALPLDQYEAKLGDYLQPIK